MFRLKNILNSPISSLLGTLLILAALASVLWFRVSWTEASIAITAGVGLMFAKDNTKGGNGAAVLLGMVVLFCFTSCRSSSKVVSSVNHQLKDSVSVSNTVNYHDTVITTDADSSQITADVKVDSAGNVNLAEVQIENKKVKATAKITDGKLQVNCICKELEFKLKVAEYQRNYYKNISDIRQSSKSDSKVKTVRFIPNGLWFSIILNLIFVGWFILKTINKIKG